MIYKNVRFQFKDPITEKIETMEDVAVNICENYIYVVEMKVLKKKAKKKMEKELHKNKSTDHENDSREKKLTDHEKEVIEKEIDALIEQCPISNEIHGKSFSSNISWKITKMKTEVEK